MGKLQIALIFICCHGAVFNMNGAYRHTLHQHLHFCRTSLMAFDREHYLFNLLIRPKNGERDLDYPYLLK